jgi:hypothetical protein
MSYVVASGHIECLKSGRMVTAGTELSNTEARQNPRLIERGVLIERAAKPQSKPAKSTPAKPDSKNPAPVVPEKEESK